MMSKLCSKLFVICLLCLVQTQLYADETLWQSGSNLYIKLTEQDELRGGKTFPNQHPVNLGAQDISNALNSVQLWNKHYFKDDEIVTVFSLQQARLLGQYLASGLRQARPDQDIVFVLSRIRKQYMVVQELTYMAGRVFYTKDGLNIIIGDYNKMPDKFKERVYKSSGISEIPLYLTQGRRSKPSGFKGILVNNGVSIGASANKVRKDWLVIDVKQAAAAYVAEHTKNNGPAEQLNNAAFREEVARLAKERREMRLEMARLRKEMKQSSNGNSLSVEDRLRKLNALKDKSLITNEEYTLIRKEILSEI